MSDTAGCMATFTWKITNLPRDLEYLSSPQLSGVEEYEDTEWHLSISTNENKVVNRGFFCCDLWISVTEESDLDLSLLLMLEIADNNGKILKTVEGGLITERGEDSVNEFPPLMKIEELREAIEMSGKDTIVIRCRAFNNNERMPTMLWEACTEFVAQKRSFQYEVLFTDSQEWSRKAQGLPFREFDEFFISLTTMKDLIKLNVKSKNELSTEYYFKLKISILNDERVEVKLEKDEYFFVPTDDENVLQFLTSFAKILVENKKNQYSFTLMCDITRLVEQKYIKSYYFDKPIAWEQHQTANSLSISHLKFDTIRGLQDDLKNMFLSDKHSDVKLRVSGKIFPAHKVLLSARSPVFSAMFDHDMLEKESGIVEISEVDPEVFQSFLEYCYTDIFENTSYERNLRLMLLADKYQIDTLKKRCSQTLMSGLSLQNICEVVSAADMVNQHDLKSESLNFIKAYKKEVFTSPYWCKWMKKNLELANEILMNIAIE